MVNIGLLRAQIKSGLRNVRCLVVVALSLFIVGFQWWSIRHLGYRIHDHESTFLDEVLLFSPDGSGTALYLFLFPFLAALVGGSVLATEKQSHRLELLEARLNYGVVERTSLCSGFLLGAFGGVLPFLTSIIFCAIRNPHLSFIDGVMNSDAKAASSQYILVWSEGRVYPIYRYNQVLCIATVGLLVAVLSGLFTCLAIASSPFMTHKYVEVLVPTAFLLLWWAFPVLVPHPGHAEDINPILYLQVNGFTASGSTLANLIGVAVTLIGLPLIVVMLCWLQRKFHE